MITPLELEKAEFDHAFMGGYKRRDVDEFLTTLTADYEELYKENIANRDKISLLEDVVQKYKAMEDSLQSALLLAQTSGEAAVRAAQEKAQNIIKEAEMKAAYLAKEADARVEETTNRSHELQRNINVFVARNVSQLRAQIEILNGMVTAEEAAPMPSPAAALADTKTE